jgi:hypothetical protein
MELGRSFERLRSWGLGGVCDGWNVVGERGEAIAWIPNHCRLVFLVSFPTHGLSYRHSNHLQAACGTPESTLGQLDFHYRRESMIPWKNRMEWMGVEQAFPLDILR